MAPLRILPRPLALRLAGAAGRTIVGGLPFLRRRIRRNLAHALPRLDRTDARRIAHATGDQFGKVILEYFLLDRIAKDPPPLAVSGPGLDALHAARAAGRGAVLVSAHLGNWEMIRLSLQQRGIACAMIYRAFNNAPFDRFVRARMTAVGEPVLSKGRAGMRAFVTHVARGGAALILVDQKQSGAPNLPFLGQPAETALAAADLASRCKAPLIPVRALRRPGATGFDLLFEAPLPEAPSAERMAAVNARIGTWIRDDPEQWFWLHDRWRLRKKPV